MKGIKIIDLGGMKCSRSATMDRGCCLPDTGLVASLRRLYPVNRPCSRSATGYGRVLFRVLIEQSFRDWGRED